MMMMVQTYKYKFLPHVIKRVINQSEYVTNFTRVINKLGDILITGVTEAILTDLEYSIGVSLVMQCAREMVICSL